MKLKLGRISKIALATALLCAPIAAVASSSNVISAKTAANKKHRTIIQQKLGLRN